MTSSPSLLLSALRQLGVLSLILPAAGGRLRGSWTAAAPQKLTWRIVTQLVSLLLSSAVPLAQR